MDIVVSPLVKVVGDKLGSALSNEFSMLWGVKKDLKTLGSNISTIRDVLDDAEQCCLKDKQVFNWLRELKEVVYDADDLLDTFILEKRKMDSYGQTSRVIRNVLSEVNPIKRSKLGKQIKSINERLDTIAAKRTKFHLQITATGSREETYPINPNTLPMVSKNLDTFSMVDEDSIFGRDDEREEIMSQLKQSDGNKNISIISIVGLGGLGKTTLAQLVYNNKNDMEGYFDSKIWVYVSQKFDVGRIMRAIIESLSKTKCDLENLDPLATQLVTLLTGKRFLLVLDDIWNENQNDWDKLKVVFNYGASGSKIIATTRSMEVSRVMESTSIIVLKGLSEETSWALFKQRAFSGSESTLSSQIHEIAKEIIKKCGGVPLALKALGAAMNFNKNVKDWEKARDSDIWEIDKGNEVMASLKLSYIKFRPQLKECFTYCSIFPKGYVINKQELIDQWMANRLVSFTRSARDMEVDLGNKYFEQLVRVSFFQNVVERFDSAEVTCNMHDLVHDLAQSISDQRILIINDTCKAINKDNGEVNPTKIKKMRAIHMYGHSNVINMVSEAQSLRSLFLEWIPLPVRLPISMSKLIHLRYICMSYCWITVIPNDIGTLWSLEALHLRNCYMIEYLPESIGKLINLRTLKLHGCRKLKKVPESIGNLINLQTLDLCEDLNYLPESIGNLDKLCFLNLQNCESLEKLPESIGNLINLQTLELKWCKDLKYLPESIGNLDKLCFLNLQKCENLKKLPESIGNLINLQTLELKWCKDLKYLPESIGNLDKLCFLNLQKCENLEKLPESIGNLINLQTLDLSLCKNLKNLPESIGNLANLHVLDLHYCDLNAIPKSIYNLTKLTPANLDDFQNFYCMPTGTSELNGPDIQGLSNFSSVEDNKLACMSELQHLNIRGRLKISELQNLNDPEEATLANLKKKENLNGLKLIWYHYASYNDCVEYSSLPVLEALQPPLSIKSLKLKGYPREQYPNWMMLSDETRMTLFPNLTSLILSHLESCSTLPSLVELPHLKYLKLEGMLNLTNYSGFFPSLVKLEFHEMPNLEEVTTMKLDTENVYYSAFPRLSKLVISGCPKVRIQPRLLPSVVELELEKSNEELLGVEFFNGEYSSEICSQPLGIRELIIREMGTQLVWLKQLSSLTRLQFWRCERNCLPESMLHLSSLRVLEISFCKGLHALPEWLGELKSLEQLAIWWTPLTCLPESLKHMSSLRELTFSGYEGLRVLPEWFGELKSLERLAISWTPLTCLPKSMKQLTALQYLSIEDCPELERRCEREKGEDWHLISHIPHVYISDL
ncbi:hypothetical protein LUZ63_013096 [Rhynchospora breviuscula]|uniref:Uncharacterized protein n=1 Tax=Rhynchospora breviuscula TaxID=2022672 RepID=A0A9Q0C7W2_9POAL|nr:hypothetical protein LUZ63_013096 [Rhynchospora breviuscula]